MLSYRVGSIVDRQHRPGNRDNLDKKLEDILTELNNMEQEVKKIGTTDQKLDRVEVKLNEVKCLEEELVGVKEENEFCGK